MALRRQLPLRRGGDAERLGVHPEVTEFSETRFDLDVSGRRASAVKQLHPRDGAQAEFAFTLDLPHESGLVDQEETHSQAASESSTSASTRPATSCIARRWR